MSTDLFDLLGMDPDDPETREALEDAEVAERIVATLIDLRQRQRLTQTQVAERMGTTQSVVSKFEQGTGDPHLSTLQRYARAVNARLYVNAATPRVDGAWRHVEDLSMHGTLEEADVPTWVTRPFDRRLAEAR